MVLELIPKTKVFTEIIHPYPTVLLHAFLKGMQGGLLLGFVVGNCVAIYKRFIKKKKKYYSWKKVVWYMGKGMILGIVVVTGLTLNTMFKSDFKTNQSRAFRLKNNSKENIIDNVTICSLVIGQMKFRNFEDQELGGG